MRGDAIRCVTIPQLGHAPALAAGRDDVVDAREHARAIATDDDVRALLYGDRTLGVLAHRQARHAERGRLFLDAARVGDDGARVSEQTEHFEIALWRQQRNRRTGQHSSEAVAVDVRPRARMYGPDERQPLRDVGEDPERRG